MINCRIFFVKIFCLPLSNDQGREKEKKKAFFPLCPFMQVLLKHSRFSYELSRTQVLSRVHITHSTKIRPTYSTELRRFYRRLMLSMNLSQYRNTMQVILFGRLANLHAQHWYERVYHMLYRIKSMYGTVLLLMKTNSCVSGLFLQTNKTLLYLMQQ